MTAPTNPGHYADERRSALVGMLEEAGLEPRSATAWAQALSASAMRYVIDVTASRVAEFATAGFAPADGVPFLEAGFSPKQAREAIDVFGRTLADLHRIYAAAEERVRLPFANGDYYVFDKAGVEANVAALMCSHVPVHEAELVLRTGASPLWAVYTHAACLRDNDTERWSAEMLLVALGATPEAPANPPEWWDQWRSEHAHGARLQPPETTDGDRNPT